MTPVLERIARGIVTALAFGFVVGMWATALIAALRR